MEQVGGAEASEDSKSSMKVAQIIPSIEEEASGPSYSVVSLSLAMNRIGVDSTVVAAGPPRADQETRIHVFPRVRPVYKLGRSPAMYCWLMNEAQGARLNMLHNHSLWMMPNIYPGWVAKRTTVPLVVSPRGTLSRWALARSRHRKQLMWHALQRSAIDVAKLFHATSEEEYADIRRAGFRQPIAVIPNGIDIPQTGPRCERGDRRTVLFLGRVHPVKGIENLLNAWAALEPQFLDWDLRIVGPGEATYVEKLRKQATILGLQRTTFAGPLYGAEKTKAYQSAELFVLPTHSENFGMVVAEALAVGCPVVTTKGAPWSGLVANETGWWVDIGVEPLKGAMTDALSRNRDALARRGANGRSWMERDFSWDGIATRMIESYRWMLGKASLPDWIRHD